MIDHLMRVADVGLPNAPLEPQPRGACLEDVLLERLRHLLQLRSAQ